MSSKTSSVHLGRYLSYSGIILIGLYCLFSSIYQRQFAQIHFECFGLPIFLGEILLFICGVLAVLKWRKSKPLPITFRQWHHWFLAAYIVFILGKAFAGYQNGGAFAFRNAALYYYPFFAVIGYYLFERSFFNKKMIWLILGTFIVTKIVIDINNYYVFPFYFISFALLTQIDNRYLKFALLIPVLYLRPYHFSHPDQRFFPFIFFFVGRRARLLGHLAGYSFLAFYISFVAMQASKRVRIIFFIIIMLLIGVGVVKFADQSNIQSLTKISSIFNLYKKQDAFIQEQKTKFTMKNIEPKLYSKEELGLTGRMEWTVRNINPYAKEAPIEIETSIREKISTLKVQKFEQFSKDEESLNKEMSQAIEIAKKKLSGDLPKLEKTITEIRAEYETKINQALAIVRQDIKNEVEFHLKFYGLDNEIDSVAVWELTQEKKDRRELREANNNILFRLFIWRDMLQEMLEQPGKWAFGFDFDHPQRSISVEILSWGSGEWGRDGWIAPHNSYLHIIYRAGLFGVLCLVILFACLIRLIRDIFQYRILNGVFLTSIIIYWLVVSLFSVFLELPYSAIPFWSLLGMLWAYVEQYKQMNPIPSKA